MKITAKHILIAVAVLAVAGILIAGRLSGGGTSGVPVGGPAAASPSGSSAQATPAASGPDSDDGVADEPQTPILIQPTTKPDVREAGTRFAAAWLNTYNRSAADWRAGLTPRVTADLAGDLAYADPASVPAAGRVGTVTVAAEESLYDVTVAVITADKGQPVGDLKLTMVSVHGTWLVSEIDWTAAP